MKKVLITGGAGFIGSHLAEYLMNSGHLVLVIDNLSSGRMGNLSEISYNKNFLFSKTDITSDALEDIFFGFKPETVYHLAAIPGVQFSIDNPCTANQTNLSGLLNVLELSRLTGVSRLVFSSSSAVYGNASTIPTPEDVALSPQSPYALQKFAGEMYCKMYSDIYGLDTVCLRYFNVMGPRQYGDSPYSSVISLFANSIKNNKIPIIYGDGEQSRDFCPVGNVVLANYLAGSRKEKFGGIPINIGMGKSISVNKLLSLMRIEGASYLDSRIGEVRHSAADINRAISLLGYFPLFDFESELQKTIEWYIKL